MSEIDPLAGYRAGIAHQQRANEAELGKRISLAMATQTVRHLGQRAITVVQRLGVEFPEYQGDQGVFSKQLPLGSVDDLNFALSFGLWVDYTQRLSPDGETVTPNRKRYLKLPGRSITPEDKLGGVLPKRIEAWIDASDPQGNTTQTRSEILGPMNPEHFVNNMGMYAYSNVGRFGASQLSHKAALGAEEYALTAARETVDNVRTGRHQTPDFMAVAGHIQVCIRKAEHDLGIAPPADEAHLASPDLEETLAISK